MTTAKKVVAKKAAPTQKKPGAKKNLKNAKRVLVKANGEQCFWTQNGIIISTLVELRDALSTIGDDVFAYHANRQKNDFADWVGFVLGDAELAKAIRTAQKPKTAREHVVRRLKIYDI